MSNPDRLSGLDASFLHLEDGGAHMHVASVTLFDGPPADYHALLAHVQSRLHLVPRFRKRLATVPLEQGRPVWVDDPRFNLGYHVRHAALPAPGGRDELKELAGRVFARRLDRAKPLWEIWLVEGLRDGGFALLSKTHHALVDGVAGVDITTVLFDAAPDPAPVAPPDKTWVPRPLPSGAQLLADALVERAVQPAEALRGLRRVVRAPRRAAAAARDGLVGLGAMAWAGLSPAPPSLLNVPIGPHRRYAWVDADLAELKGVKDALGGTVNDVVLAVVAGALGRYLRLHGTATAGLELKAMVPVSVRSDDHRGALGNRVAAMWAPLPVGVEDPGQQLELISAAMRDLKASGQAVGAQVLTDMTGFAPPTLMSQAARLQARQRYFNLVVTNVPGPQMPLYVLGRRMRALYPVVPIARNQALGIAVMSYDGRLGFGLLGDYDALPDLEQLAAMLEDAIAALVAAAAEGRRPVRSRSAPRARRPPAPARA